MSIFTPHPILTTGWDDTFIKLAATYNNHSTNNYVLLKPDKPDNVDGLEEGRACIAGCIHLRVDTVSLTHLTPERVITTLLLLLVGQLFSVKYPTGLVDII